LTVHPAELFYLMISLTPRSTLLPYTPLFRSQRPARRRVPLVRPRRAERQHDRLGGPHHAPADRRRRLVPEREEPAAEQGAGAARSEEHTSELQSREKVVCLIQLEKY